MPVFLDKMNSLIRGYYRCRIFRHLSRTSIRTESEIETVPNLENLEILENLENLENLSIRQLREIQEELKAEALGGEQEEISYAEDLGKQILCVYK